MGAAESVTRSLDKRTARRKHRGKFQEAITAEIAKPVAASFAPNPDARVVRVCIRKRPIFSHELDAGEFDVISVAHGRGEKSTRASSTGTPLETPVNALDTPVSAHKMDHATHNPDHATHKMDHATHNSDQLDHAAQAPPTHEGRVSVFDCRTHPDMRNLFIDKHTFHFDRVFGEEDGNAVVYAESTRGIVESVMQGADGTVLMYGQTGSGKTYTMSSIYRAAASDLFRHAEQHSSRVSMRLSFIELAGNSCRDILNQGNPLKLAAVSDGSVEAFPSVEVPIHSAAEMVALIDHAVAMRSTAATGVNDVSSRTHAICRVYVVQEEHSDTKGPEESPRQGSSSVESLLTLVDLAGSERNIDSCKHDAQRRKEGAQINSSLMKLKECVRAKEAGASYIPYRHSSLTHLLSKSFKEPEPGQRPAQTVIIATVSPASKDTEHTVNTLRHASLMDGQAKKERRANNQTAGLVSEGGVVERVQAGTIDIKAMLKAKREGIREQLRREREGIPPPRETPAAPKARAPPRLSSREAKALAEKSRQEYVDRDAKYVAKLDSETRQRLVGAREAAGSHQKTRFEVARGLQNGGEEDASGGCNIAPTQEGASAIQEEPRVPAEVEQRIVGVHGSETASEE